MAQRCHGVTVDGNRVVSVEMRGGKVVSARSFDADSPQAALRQWAQATKPGIPVTVTVVLPESKAQVRLVNLSTSASNNWREALNLVAKAKLPRAVDNASISGAVGELLKSGEYHLAVVGAAPAHEISAMYSILERFDAEIRLPAFTYKADGLYLSVFNTTAELTLVDQGLPVQHRMLQAGGLATLGLSMGGLHQLGAAIGGDPAVLEMTGAYAERLASEISRTTQAWRDDEAEQIPEELTIIGPAAYLQTVVSASSAYGFSPVRLPLEVPSNSNLPVSSSAEHAVMAAMATGFQPGHPGIASEILASFPNPEAVARRLTRQKTERQRSTLLRVVAGALVIAAVCSLPVVFGKYKMHAAQSELAAAEAQLSGLTAEDAKVARLHALSESYKKNSSKEVSYDVLLNNVLATAPQGTSVKTFEMKRSLTQVTISVTLEMPGDYTDLSSFMNALDKAFSLNANNRTFPTEFSVKDGRVHTTVNLTLPATAASTNRSLETK